jgi:hypothetical protein
VGPSSSLARMPAWGARPHWARIAGGPGFKSRRPHHFLMIKITLTTKIKERINGIEEKPSIVLELLLDGSEGIKRKFLEVIEEY